MVQSIIISLSEEPFIWFTCILLIIKMKLILSFSYPYIYIYIEYLEIRVMILHNSQKRKREKNQQVVFQLQNSSGYENTNKMWNLFCRQLKPWLHTRHHTSSLYQWSSEELQCVINTECADSWNLRSSLGKKVNLPRFLTEEHLRRRTGPQKKSVNEEGASWLYNIRDVSRFFQKHAERNSCAAHCSH